MLCPRGHFQPDVSSNRARTKAYAEMYLSDQRTFKWAGMVALVSNQVGMGIRALSSGDVPATFPGPALGVDPLQLRRALNLGNKLVYDDIYDQHIAFRGRGLNGINEGIAKQSISVSAMQLAGWTDISRGLVWPGNKLLLENEQLSLLQPKLYNRYAAMMNSFFDLVDNFNMLANGQGFFVAALPPVPGTRAFSNSVPGGRISNGADRWRWIEQDMLPAYQRYEGTQKMIDQMREFAAMNIYE